MWWRHNDQHNLINRATGGHSEVPSDWMSGTGLHSIIRDDPFVLWCKYWGKHYGFEEDPAEYSFLEFIAEQGRRFESAWLRNVAPEAVRAMENDTDVRDVSSVVKTLELMRARTPVISKAALWWAPERLYGSADAICWSEWWYDKFPHLRPREPEEPHYIVVDCKFTTELTTNNKKVDLECYEAQMRIYSLMLSKLTATPIPNAYLVTRDRLHDPIRVSVAAQPNMPLGSALAEMRDRHIDIKLNGHSYLPWRDAIVAPNFSEEQHDAPWHNAKKLVAEQYMSGLPLEYLPHVGAGVAKQFRAQGFTSIQHMLSTDVDSLPLVSMKGLGKTTAPRLHAILRANKHGMPSSIPLSTVPARKRTEFYVDYEYFTNLNVDFDREWPENKGKEMVFMIGIGWVADGKWNYKQFTAQEETIFAERAMFQEFIDFVARYDVFDHYGNAALYHWTNAEVWQSKRAAERLALPALLQLPFVDLQKCALEALLAFPGAYDYSLKTIAKCLTRCFPQYGVTWPEGLADGLSAMVIGWSAYMSGNPQASPEMVMLSEYLQADVRAMERVLSYMRDTAIATPAPTNSTTQKTKPRSRKKRSSEAYAGWYKFALLASAGSNDS